MRTLSLNFRNALFAQESGEVAAFLLTITHPSLAQPIRLSSDPTVRITTEPLVYGTTSRGNDYLFVGMDLALPDEKEASPPASKMMISNVDRETIALARSINSPAEVLIECILASAPDAIETTIPVLEIINVNYDAAQLTFDLAMDALAIEPFPAGTFSPSSFAGLFV